ncbi:MAG: hypothetical protein IPJ00_12170 [Saprospirales bacterium]|nr:hypothetical protein [Saprospirales bacterium]
MRAYISNLDDVAAIELVHGLYYQPGFDKAVLRKFGVLSGEALFSSTAMVAEMMPATSFSANFFSKFLKAEFTVPSQ